jgi:hypothetical protein
MNDLKILSVSYGVVIVFIALAVAKRTFAAYSAVFAKRQFEYIFDKTRLPQVGRTLLLITGICFAYAFLISNQIGNVASAEAIGRAIGFCLFLVPFVTLGCLLTVGYVPRGKKQNSRKIKKSDSWLV